MRTRRTVLTTLAGAPAAGALLLTAAGPRAASAQTQNPFRNAAVTGQLLNPAGRVIGAFAGTLTVTQFAAQNGQLVAQGTLSGTATNLAGQALGAAGTITNQAVTLPVVIQQTTCTILTLVLGPLDLTLLGLRIQLNQVVLTITADPEGGLLGALLCAIANLLAPGGPLANVLNALVAFLNDLLALLALLG
jgi:hypothetical protein